MIQTLLIIYVILVVLALSGSDRRPGGKRRTKVWNYERNRWEYRE